MIDVVLCDDHALIRRGIRNTLSDAPDIRVVGEAVDYGDLRDLMRKLTQQRAQQRLQGRAFNQRSAPTSSAACDVLVLDINLPGRGGLDVLQALKDEGSPVRVLVVSMYPEDQYALRVLRAGAYGYVNKSSDPQLIVEGVRTVAMGKRYVTPEIAQMLVDNLHAPVGEARHEALSNRELQVLIKLASGKRPADIALELSLSAKTVYVYRDRVKQKLNLANDTEITKYALRHGLIAQ